MTPAARIAAVIDILESLYADGVVTSSAAQALRSSMQRRRYAGSGDRNAISDLFWQIQRGLSRLCWHLENCNAEITGRHLVLAALVLMERQHDAVPGLFSAEIEHAPAPLSEAEIAAIPILAAGSAMRFFLTRLYDWLNTPKDALVSPKDPMEYWAILRFHQSVSGVGAYGFN